MKCTECMYCWQAEDDDFPICHCPENDIAPCEYEEDDYEQ